MKDKNKLMELSPSQLEEKLKELQENARELRFDKIVSSVDNPAKFRNIRRNIARVKTLLKEYQLELSKWEDSKRVRVKNFKVKGRKLHK